jgi:ATP-dependent Clp protease adaptor protein ClpS
MSIVPLPDLLIESQIDFSDWIVRVHNNDKNTYDEVISILMQATGCDAQEAYLEAWEIDHLGSCVVHYGAQQECRDAAGIIATIGIRVEVAQE